MKAAGARLWAYVRSYFSVLLVSLGLVAVVGVLEAATPFLIGLIFDTLLGLLLSKRLQNIARPI